MLGLHRAGEGKGWGWSRAQLPRLLPAVPQTGTATQLEAELGQGQGLFPLVLFEDVSLTVGTRSCEV